MEGRHLSLEVWARCLSGRLEHEELVGEVVPHILALCPACREIYDDLARIKETVGHWDELVALLEGRDAEALWAELGGRPAEELLALAGDERLHAWGFCQRLIGESRKAVFDDPTAAVDLAALAVKIAAHLGDAYDPAWVADLRARAAATLGNARRVLGELRGANQAFLEAREHLARGTGDPLVEAGVLDLEASLRRAERRFPEAFDLIEKALASYRNAGRWGLVASALVKKAKIAADSGAHERGIALLGEAAPLAEEHGDAHLRFVVQHNLF